MSLHIGSLSHAGMGYLMVEVEMVLAGIACFRSDNYFYMLLDYVMLY